MSGRAAVVVMAVVAGSVMTAGGRVGAAGQSPSFDQLYRAYAAGDRDIVSRRIRTGRDVGAARPPLDEKSLRRWLGGWDRTKAAFLLEFADAEALLSAHHLTAIVTGARYVMTRPMRLGQDAGEDAFEAAWHKSAIALLQNGRYQQLQDAYLDTVDARYEEPRRSGSHAVDPRFALARGIATEQRCATLDSALRNDCLRDAARRFQAAALASGTADEANVRLAWIEFQLGAHADALRTIDLACPSDDPDLIYWQHLFRGRILESLHRVPEAAGDYRKALEARPHAQSAAVALALALFSIDRPAEAVDAARDARVQPADVIDPWWTYLRGDARLVARWRTEIREHLQ